MAISPVRRLTRSAARRTLPLTLTLLLSIAAAALRAQSGPVLKTSRSTEIASTGAPDTEGNLITIPIVVHDKHGALIQNLTKDSFTLWIDKKPATIRSFTQDAAQPLTIGLLVDVSASQRDALNEERKASASFLADTLTPRDQAFVVQFARQVDLLQDSTSSKPKLQDGLQQLSTVAATASDNDTASNSTPASAPQNPGSSGPYGRGPYGRGSGSSVPVVGAARRPNTVLYDALFLSSDQVMAKQAGRKVLIVLSDGTDHGSKESLASAIEAAQRADTIVYAIYFKGIAPRPDHSDRHISMGEPDQCDPYGYPGGGYPGGYPPYGYPGGGYPGDCTPGTGPTRPVESNDGRKLLDRITEQTGGRLFEMDKKDSLAGIYKQIADELHAQYRITYTPDKDASSDGYHRIDVSLKGDPKDLFVQTREGYYAGPPD